MKLRTSGAAAVAFLSIAPAAWAQNAQTDVRDYEGLVYAPSNTVTATAYARAISSSSDAANFTETTGTIRTNYLFKSGNLAIVPIDLLFTAADQTVYVPTGMGPTSTAINTSGLYDLTYLPTIGYYVTEDEKSETHTYFAATVYVTAPTGNYDTAKPVNFGENRWRLAAAPHRRAAIRQGVHLRGQRKRRDLHVELEVQHRDGARDHEADPTFGFEAHLGADLGVDVVCGYILLSGGRRPANAGLADDSGRAESADHADDALSLWHPHREVLDAPSAVRSRHRGVGRRANHPLPRRPLQPLDLSLMAMAGLVALASYRCSGRATAGGRWEVGGARVQRRVPRALGLTEREAEGLRGCVTVETHAGMSKRRNSSAFSSRRHQQGTPGRARVGQTACRAGDGSRFRRTRRTASPRRGMRTETACSTFGSSEPLSLARPPATARQASSSAFPMAGERRVRRRRAGSILEPKWSAVPVWADPNHLRRPSRRGHPGLPCPEARRPWGLTIASIVVEER